MARGNQVYQQLSGVGESFADSYFKGKKMKLLEEQRARKNRQEAYEFVGNERKEYQRLYAGYGKETEDKWLESRRKSDEYEFYEVPENFKFTPGGSTITLTGEAARERLRRVQGFPDNEEGRQLAIDLINANGWGDAIVFNVFGDDAGKLNQEETAALTESALGFRKDRADIDKKDAETKYKQKQTQNIGKSKDKMVKNLLQTSESLESLMKIAKGLPDFKVQALNKFSSFIAEQFGHEGYAQFKTISTIAAKQLATAFENGRLSDFDHTTYLQALPSAEDTVQQRLKKAKTLQELIDKVLKTSDGTYESRYVGDVDLLIKDKDRAAADEKQQKKDELWKKLGGGTPLVY